MKKIGLLHGPNLSHLGEREPEIYGRLTLTDIISSVENLGQKHAIEIINYQSNIEGELVNCLWCWKNEGVEGLILNPGGYSHTSIALRDAIAGTGIPAIEVHISNIYAREGFRQTLITAGACRGVISGFGLLGYTLAFEALLSLG